MEHVKCDLCGADQPRSFLQTVDRFSGQSFHLVTCQQCGLLYLTPRPTQEELGAYYPDHYEAYHDPDQTLSASDRWHARRMLDMQVDFVERFQRERGRLLDVGCATGDFIRAAQTRGWQVQGIELNERVAQVARDRYGLSVISGTLESATTSQPTVDADMGRSVAAISQPTVITMWDVLEHLPSPREALKRCHQLLAPGGLLIFSIPNLDSFDRYLFRSEWIGWDPPRHFNLFSHAVLLRLFQETGFAFVERRCFLGGKGTFFLSLERLLAANPKLQFVRRLYPLISAALWPYRQFSYALKRGPIIAYVARKVG
ncbi:MAG: class I SAM-dependent methyltransferase [Anaerolineales bacterium]|nr:class I SAM-dependent methyltransferase [Anaerolineales bacterium]